MNDGYANMELSIIDWIGVALLIPFGVLVVCLITYLILGCIGSGKRRRQVLQERAAERQAAQSAKERPHLAAPIVSDAADGT